MSDNYDKDIWTDPKASFDEEASQQYTGELTNPSDPAYSHAPYTSDTTKEAAIAEIGVWAQGVCLQNRLKLRLTVTDSQGKSVHSEEFPSE